jgi:hypothetical protein
MLYPIAGLTWHLVVYADGVTPGAALAHQNRRKSVVWYISFMEFHEKLAFEEVWTAVALARTCCIANANESGAVTTASCPM